ncbi:MAG: hypothetical protein ACKOJF_26440, partial [Planctomycetaceae bacterium]
MVPVLELSLLAQAGPPAVENPVLALGFKLLLTLVPLFCGVFLMLPRVGREAAGGHWLGAVLVTL